MEVHFQFQGVVPGTKNPVHYEGTARSPEEALEAVTRLGGVDRASPAKEAPKLRVGARVRIVNPIIPSGYTWGDVGTVIRFSFNGCLKVCFDHHDGGLYAPVLPTEVEVIG